MLHSLSHVPLALRPENHTVAAFVVEWRWEIHSVPFFIESRCCLALCGFLCDFSPSAQLRSGRQGRGIEHGKVGPRRVRKPLLEILHQQILLLINKDEGLALDAETHQFALKLAPCLEKAGESLKRNIRRLAARPLFDSIACHASERCDAHIVVHRNVHEGTRRAVDAQVGCAKIEIRSFPFWVFSKISQSNFRQNARSQSYFAKYQTNFISNCTVLS
eukprot:scaffold21246_cov110-Isochrysis_galbana.AAC.8